MNDHKPISIGLPVVVTLVSLSSSVAFMIGKNFAEIQHHTVAMQETKQSLNDITTENKKLWEYILKSRNIPESRLIKEVLGD